MVSIDVLIVSALSEEIFLIEKWLKPRDNPISGIRVVEYHAETKIGIGSFGAMGGVPATIYIANALKTYWPKYIFMVGLAAAVQDSGLRRGDVGYNSEIYYTSYGKIREGEKYPEIRPLGLPGDKLISLDWLDRHRCGNRWKNDAAKWFGRFHSAWSSSYRYPAQQAFENTLPECSKANYASGELVIASDEYQKHVLDFFRGRRIDMLDMESYAVRKICHENNISFLSVKGISDYAAGDKDDKYRFCAIAASSAFVKSIVEDRKFKEGILNISPIQRRKDYCLHPNASIFCPYITPSAESQRSSKKVHGCVNLEIDLDESKEEWLTRVFEDIEPVFYSTKLSNYLPGIIERKEARVTFFFPYSAKELLNFFLVHNGKAALKEKIRDVLTMSENRNKSDIHVEKQIANQIEKISHIVKDDYRHFKTSDDICESLLKIQAYDETANCATRIIMVQDARRETILDEPLNVIYPCFLGMSVPTFCTERENLERSFVASDITFLDRSISGSANSNKNGSDTILAIRFLNRDRTLIVSGQTCRDVGFENHRAMFRLLDDWNNHRMDTLSSIQSGQHGKYRQFPFRELIQKYLPDSSLAEKLNDNAP